jgi:hypothetical protein
MKPQSVPRPAVRLLGWISIVLLPLLILEATAALYYTIRDRGFVSVYERLGGRANTYVSAFNTSPECSYLKVIYPHPYLAHAHNIYSDPSCWVWTNRVGLLGRDYPLQREPGIFTILLSGGSVAAQLGQLHSQGPFFLEEALNGCFKPPHGDRFVVLNGGAGAWKQPNQAILFLLYGEAFDAVVTLDGFNEHYSLEHRRLEVPSNNFVVVNPAVTDGHSSVAAAWLANEMIRYAKQHPILKRSFAAYAVIGAIRQHLERVGTRPRGGVTALDTMFALPESWNIEQKFNFNMEQYRKYIRAIEVMAKSQAARTAYFVQPVPAIGKVLTEEEKRVVGSLDYAALYRRMTDQLLELAKEGIPIFSLLDVFADERQTLYSDPIHAKVGTDADSPAYRIVAATMARRIAETWSLERTCPKRDDN